MKEAINKILKENDLTVRGISRKYGINKDMLSYNFNRPYTQWKYGLVAIIAKATHNTIHQFVDDIINGGWCLEINDKRQSIQDVCIPSYNTYMIIKDSTLNSCFKGWKPNSQDIKDGLHDFYHSSDITKDCMHHFRRDMNKLSRR